ncbi:MAG: UDP-N-acetylmuramoyl-tripeptide--D-alanyl-D-alanine ligase [Pseudomonadota bacterium]|nr:UDP-N-acetylmuramoyl-tripeptide--D-alanyl-D-alanine ligase [Pseudomonadota bacterium]
MVNKEKTANNTEAQSVEQTVAALQAQINPESNRLTEDLTMFSWTLEQLKESTNGDLIGPLSEENSIRFTSISTDTRTLQPGALYIAIKGENFDGHAFIDKAIQQGAVAVLVSEDVDTVVPGVEVEDTRIALGQFARWHRLQMPVKTLIAVTGSNGKTTTKTLLNNIFSLAGNTLATEGNLNNDLGVPRTLLNLRPEHEYAIIEMGANHLKEIGYLTDLALPDIAMINNASGAHLEGFGSLQGVIDTKGEIYQGLNQIAGRKDGVAIVNTDSPGYQDWLTRLDRLGVKQVISFGTHPEAKVRISDFKTLESESSGISFHLNLPNEKHQVSMPVLGFHNAMNAGACVAVSQAAGLSWQQILPGLVSFTGVSGRLQKTAINTGWLIDDSYNANPESVKAGIDALVSLPGLAILCLGAMAEIGEGSAAAHQEIAKFAKDKGVKNLYVYGEEARCMLEAFGENSQFFATHEEMAKTVLQQLSEAEQNQQKMNVLVKGSRSARMELVSEQVLEAFSQK